MIRMTLEYVICLPTQSSVIQTIHCNVGLKCFFLPILPKCLWTKVKWHVFYGPLCMLPVWCYILQSLKCKWCLLTQSLLDAMMQCITCLEFGSSFSRKQSIVWFLQLKWEITLKIWHSKDTWARWNCFQIRRQSLITRSWSIIENTCIYHHPEA